MRPLALPPFLFAVPLADVDRAIDYFFGASPPCFFVCSILGTWEGPRWTPVHSISSVLLSIQSLMNEKPYHNEPG